MVKMIKNGILVGLGVLNLTREQVAKFVAKLIKEDQNKPKEAPSVISQLLARGEEERKALHHLVRCEREEIRARFPVARGDFAELAWTVDDLAEKLELLLPEHHEQ